MPSQADQDPRQVDDADSREEPFLADPRAALQRPLSQLERYAGWLAKDHASVAVRADVQALGTAVNVGTETFSLLITLDKNIGRLPRGDMRKMLRKTLGEVRALMGQPGVDLRHREGS